MNNYLYLGDCLDVLQDYVKDETVDLIYIDPPFNSKRNYNVFFDDKEIHSQRIAFEDTWSLKNVGDSLQQLHIAQYDDLYNLLKVYQKLAPQVFPYLVMMALRIVELHRVLKPTGSFYLHCDPTASHYLKTICDTAFGMNNFCNHLTWKRSDVHNDAKKKYPSVTDHILLYRKSDEFTFKKQHIAHADRTLQDWYQFLEFPDGSVRRMTKEEKETQIFPEETRRFNTADMASPNPRPNLMYEYKGFSHPPKGWRYSLEKMKELDEQGLLLFPSSSDGRIMLKRYLDEQQGAVISDLWLDISQLRANNAEGLGYPTQKPKALLERIIEASSNENDLILDAFCGCGTSIDAAEGLKRRWIGIDISPLALSVIKRRLRDAYKGDLSKFEIRGIPTDEKSAIKLWEQNAFAFQDWWITEFEAFSSTFGKKGADKGVDGIALYALPQLAEPLRVAFQVKGGEKVQAKDIDVLLGAMVVHKCELGVFLTRAAPTKPMLDKVMTVGYFEMGNQSYPKLQILTLAEFFNNLRPKLPSHNVTFKSAVTTGKGGEQKNLL